LNSARCDGAISLQRSIDDVVWVSGARINILIDGRISSGTAPTAGSDPGHDSSSGGGGVVWRCLALSGLPTTLSEHEVAAGIGDCR
jgi:hypothetical protein